VGVHGGLLRWRDATGNRLMGVPTLSTSIRSAETVRLSVSRSAIERSLWCP
jgi:hypothetical protein